MANAMHTHMQTRAEMRARRDYICFAIMFWFGACFGFGLSPFTVNDVDLHLFNIFFLFSRFSLFLTLSSRHRWLMSVCGVDGLRVAHVSVARNESKTQTEK